MDPNANLNELLKIASQIIEAPASWRCPAAKYERMADLVEALNDWLSEGGFLPAKWDR